MTVRIGNIDFSEHTHASALDLLGTMVKEGKECCQVVVANTHSVAVAYRSPEFEKVCKDAEVVLADGMPVVWLSKLLRERIPERVAGPDLMLSLVSMCEEKGFGVFLLGGTESDLSHLSTRLKTRFPRLRVCGHFSPPFGVWPEEVNSRIVGLVNESLAEVLLVGVSTPKQDMWIANHKHLLRSKLAIGFGAAFDFHSGKVQRAPLWMQRWGLEWFYRFLQEPRRMWKRYLVSNLIFTWIALIEVCRRVVRRETSKNA